MLMTCLIRITRRSSVRPERAFLLVLTFATARWRLTADLTRLRTGILRFWTRTVTVLKTYYLPRYTRISTYGTHQMTRTTARPFLRESSSSAGTLRIPMLEQIISLISRAMVLILMRVIALSTMVKRRLKISTNGLLRQFHPVWLLFSGQVRSAARPSAL